MQRKVIKQGHNTLTITLPAKWCANNNIKPGDELSFLIENKKLSIVPKAKLVEKEKFVDIKNADVLTLAKILISLYETGNNTIKLRYDNDTIESWYHDISPTKAKISYFVGRLVGFEIISQTANSVTITNISENITKFDQMLARTFFIMEEALEQQKEYLKGGAKKSIAIGDEIHDNIAKFTSLMIRTLHTSNESQAKLLNLMSLITLMDKMADFLRYLFKNAEHIKKPSETIIELSTNLLDYMKKYRNFYYAFSYHKIKELNSVRGHMKKLLRELKNKDELVVAGYMEAFSECLNAAIKPRVSMDFLDE